MAEGDEEQGAENEDGQQGGGKRRGLFLIIGLVILGLAGGGVGYFLASGGGDSSAGDEESVEPVEAETGEAASADSEEATEDESSDAEKTASDGEASEGEGDQNTTSSASQENFEFGESFSFKSFHLNLGNPLENRYIRMEIAVEYLGGESQKMELEARTPQLRDAVISVTSKKTREFLLSPDGKDRLRLEILNQINQYLNKKVERVFITDMIIE